MCEQPKYLINNKERHHEHTTRSKPTEQDRPALDSKAENKIATESGASAKNKVAVSRVVVKVRAAVNRAAANKVADSAAVNQADDKTGSFETTKRREVTPAAFVISRNVLCL